MKELIDELRACANGHPLDVYAPILTSAADALESQAREIERLNAVGLVNEKLTQRIKELKAQPSGVVLPERSNERGSDGELTYEALAHNRCLDEVARLNQPASAGDERASRVNDWFLSLPPARQAVLRDDKWLLADAAFIAGQARAALSANHSEQVLEGVTVERDAFGTIHIKSGDFDFIQIQYQYPYTDNAGTWKLAERISALLAGPSASKQSDQVPDGWKLVPIEMSQEMYLTFCESRGKHGGTFRSAYKAMLAAAPSAGSQGGDV